MSRITVADLVAARVSVSAAEAVALTVAVGDRLAERGLTRLPADEHILLSSTGHVTFESVSVETDPDADSRTSVPAELAALAGRVLQLDDAEDRRSRVPGGLLVLLARSLRQIDLPPLPLPEFRAAMERFGPPDANVLAAVFWRAARVRGLSRAGGTLAPVRLESALSPKAAAEERRQRMPSATELRRYLREVERELYEARAVVPDAPSVPAVVPTRVWRGWGTGAAVAAIIAGAVLGTVVAVVLAGMLARGPLEDASGPQPGEIAGAGMALTDATPAGEGLAAPAPVAFAAEDAPESTVPVRSAHADPAQQPAASPAGNGQPLLLSSAVGRELFSPSFAPLGGTLLFHAGRDAAPLMRASLTAAGGVERIETLLDDGAANYHVSMSPDGTKIAFDSDRDGTRGVYVARADGTNPVRVSGDGFASVPSWSPGGDRLAFVRAEPGRSGVWNVWIADLATGALQQITRYKVGQPWGASWFPDGRRIAYSIEDRLMIADLDSGYARGYRTPREGHLVRTPAVSPDGRQIVFQVQRDGVWILDVERARMRRVLNDTTAEEFVWSPAGDAIAYHASRGGSYGLWRLPLGTSGG